MNNIDYKLVGSRLKQSREERNISLEEAGNKVGVNKSTVLRWESGKTEKFKIPTLEILADFYGVNSSWLIGHDVPKYSASVKLDKLGNPVISIPILGTVKAGYNYLAQENWIGTIDVDEKLAESGELFALKVHGDSMSPVLIENDIVIIKKQDDFETGDIVVAIINGDEATIKKGKKSDNSILLQPLNTNYEPLIFTYDEMKTIPVTIVGIVKQLKREF